MTIKLYRNLSERNRLDKELENELVITGNLRSGSSIINPTVLIRKGQYQDISDFNYAYIVEFSRYYFIDEIVASSNVLWSLSMHVDVLSTYKEQIRALPAIISRTEEIRKAHLLLPDDRVSYEVGQSVTTKAFPNSIGGSVNIVLVVAGMNSEVEEHWYDPLVEEE